MLFFPTGLDVEYQVDTVPTLILTSITDGDDILLARICLLENDMLHGNLTFTMALMESDDFCLGDRSSITIVFMDNEEGISNPNSILKVTLFFSTLQRVQHLSD